MIDGDTILLNLDLGFQVWKEQRVRLAGISCPEMAMEEGQLAFHFLLNKAANIETLMIKTKKIDIYGRYLGHIFYNPSPDQESMSGDEIFKEGVYLNEEIVRKGFGEMV